MAQPAAIRLASWASAVPFLRRPAYDIAGMEWMKRHVVRLPPEEIPLSTYRCYAGMNRQVYETLVGPSEYCGIGALKDWDLTERLGEIAVPTLITSGRYDEVTPKQARLLNAGLAGSEKPPCARSTRPDSPGPFPIACSSSTSTHCLPSTASIEPTVSG